MSPPHIRPAPSAYRGADRHGWTILVVESSDSVGRELVEQLCADRYHASLAFTAEHARSLARSRSIRAIVLGVLDRPHGALELLEEIRRSTSEKPWEKHLPAIVLSSSANQLDLLRAFEIGADDFIASDGHIYLELRARLRALLRRAEGDLVPRLMHVRTLEIDTNAHQVRVAGVPVELCRLEYELLVHLARDPTVVCCRGELLRAIWNQRTGAARTVDSHASRLRRKLHAAGAAGMVVNVWGVGYRLI